MILNCKVVDEIWANIETYAEKWNALGAKFLLGFNEPDGKHQTCSAEDAASKWLIVQQIANYPKFDPPLRLVSPGPCSDKGDSCPGGGSANGNSPWLNDFFDACQRLDGCNPDSIEFIAMHDYTGDFNVREDNLMSRIAGFVNNYPFSNGQQRQIWITEISVACGQGSLCMDPDHAIYRDGDTHYPTSAAD